MVKDAEAHAEEDQKFEEMIAARNTADGLIHATRKTLEDAADKVTDDEKASIEAAIVDLEEALKGDDKAEIEAKTKSLTDASSELATRLYSEQAAQADPGGAAGDAGAGEAGGGDPDAVDAEFEEVNDDEKKTG